MVVACRYWYELTDGFWGQFVLTQLPHRAASDLVAQRRCLECMQNFFGMIEYLTAWVWHGVGSVRTASGVVFLKAELPLRVGDDGELLPLGVIEEGRAVFPDESAAFV